MKLELAKFGTTLISRELGSEAFRAFQPTLQNISNEENLEIDFSGVLTLSPSWADEFLTPLANLYGARFQLKRSENLSVLASLKILEESNNIKFNIIN